MSVSLNKVLDNQQIIFQLELIQVHYCTELINSPMMANEVKTVKKPFDKKKWRNEKYSKKIKGKTRQTFEEIRKKLIHDYPLF